ncbi:MAG: GNAT family N-acetyltransferase [Cellulomonadaceae bacterium]
MTTTRTTGAPRPALPDDAPALAQLAAATFALACPPSTTAEDVAAFCAAHLSPEQFARYLNSPAHTLLVVDAAPDDGFGGPGLRAYAMLVAGEPDDPEVAAVVRERPTVMLSKFYALPAVHGRGVATALMAAVVGHAPAGARSIWLGVNQQNVRAQRFYARSGFEVVGTKHQRVGAEVHDDFVLRRWLR